MPPRKRGRKPAVSKSEPAEPEPIEEEPIEVEEEEEPVEVEEEPMLDLNTTGNNEEEEEVEEEEVEYEEVEEVEYEEVEEEEEVVEEEQEEKKETEEAKDGNEKKEAKGVGENEEKIHAELLAKPPQGSEVYLGGIPTDATEEELKRFCESSGDVVEVRMVRENNSSENKGYAFISFKTTDMASKAIKELHNSEFKGKKLRCSMSQSKNRIFIGNIPRKWEEPDLKNAVTQVGPGVIRVDLMKDSATGRSRGFGFVEYYNHSCADYSLKKLSKPDFKLDTNSPTISWADPRGSSDPGSTKVQVKAVYVKNLPKDVTDNQIKDLFERHGEIVKVVLPPPKAGHEKRYAFVHFRERASAMKALQNTERYELNGEVLECSLAKPQTDKKSEFDPTMIRAPPIVMPSYSSRSGYGMGYGSVPPAYLPQPVMAPGMAMVPMVLPDGRLGYVMQQPALGSPHNRGNNRGGGHRGSGYRRGSDNNRGGKRFRSF